MTQHIATVVAANGAGHFRRSIGVMHRLLEKQPCLQLTVYCTNRQLVSMETWWRLRDIRALGAQFVTDIECGFHWPVESADGDLLAWRDQLAASPDFLSADLVVSDNLAAILKLRPDAVLMGSFLWSEVLASAQAGNAERFVRDEIECLRKRPPMLCVGEIATRGVLDGTDAIELAWMCEQPASNSLTLGGSPRVGICGGTSYAATNEVVRLSRLLAPEYEVVVDASAEPAAVEDLAGVRRGLFREIPLSQMDIVLCRPGAGTVMDCISTNTPFLTFHEANSPEMESTASKLAAAGIADTIARPFSDDAILAALHHLSVPRNYAAASARLLALPKNGLEDAAQWLARRLLKIT